MVERKKEGLQFIESRGARILRKRCNTTSKSNKKWLQFNTSMGQD
jgi:hypothetical protein